MTGRSRKMHISTALQSFAAGAIADYPHLEGQFALIDVQRGCAYGNLDLLRQEGLSENDLSEDIKRFGLQSAEMGTSCAGRLTAPAGEGHSGRGYVIAYNEAHLGEWLLSEAQYLDAVRKLYHELGHLVVKNAGQYDTESGHFKEIAADIYSLLLIEKKLDATATERLAAPMIANASAALMRKGDIIHMTSFAVEEYMQIRSRIDFDAMTFPDAAELAWRFAVKHALPACALTKMADQFDGYRQELAKDEASAFVNMVEGLCSSDKATFETAKFYVDWCLKEDLQFGTGEVLKLETATRDRLRAVMKDSGLRIDASDILAGMPATREEKAPDRTSVRRRIIRTPKTALKPPGS